MRKLIFVLGLSLLALIVSGCNLFKKEQKAPKEPLLRQTGQNAVESFSSEEHVDADVWVVTTRNAEKNSDSTFSFSTKVSPELTMLAVNSQTSQNSIWSERDDNAYQRLAQYMAAKRNVQNCIMYIHGYGADITKLIDQSRKIGLLYQSRVIALDWPTYQQWFENETDSTYARYWESRKNAIDSSMVFGRFLKAFFQQYPETGCASITLLAQGQGNILVQSLVEKELFDSDMVYFDSIVLNAADVKRYQHRKWVSRLLIKNMEKSRIFVVFNEKDKVLNRAEDVLRSNDDYESEDINRLGNIFKKHGLALNAFYLDVSNMKPIHEGFLEPGQSADGGLSCLGKMYLSILHAQIPEYSKETMKLIKKEKTASEVWGYELRKNCKDA
ncbi:MAG: alpha/beta hydrolase [SAR324 cluster bacterium]|nr:alpha/beta hydrolase [SAR324 cluster bacterium]